MTIHKHIKDNNYNRYKTDKIEIDISSTLIVLSCIYLGVQHFCKFTPILPLTCLILLGTIAPTLYHISYIGYVLGSVLGSLVLTLSIVAIEVSLLINIVNSPTLSPYLMESVLSSLMTYITLIGGLACLVTRRTLVFNKHGSYSYLSTLLCLYAISFLLPTLGLKISNYLPVAAILTYMLFIFKQHSTHSGYFTRHNISTNEVRNDVKKSRGDKQYLFGTYMYHLGWMWVGLVCASYLSKEALTALGSLDLSPRFVTYLSCVLIALPEGISAIYYSSIGQGQKSCNLFFGSAIATMALTLPLVCIITGFSYAAVPPYLLYTSMASLLFSTVVYQSGYTSWFEGYMLLLLHGLYVILQCQ